MRQPVAQVRISPCAPGHQHLLPQPAAVVTQKVEGGGKVTEDYLRSQDGKHLFVIVKSEGGRGRSIEFRRVYDGGVAN